MSTPRSLLMKKSVIILSDSLSIVNSASFGENVRTFLSSPHMSKPTHLPDAMPEVSVPAILVVCGSHECRFINAGGKTLVERDVVAAPKPEYSDRETQMRGPSGVMSGTADRNQEEDNRLKQFANTVTTHIVAALDQGAQELYLAAPGKVLSMLKDHLPKAHAPKLKVVLDGTFLKESSLDILLRFRPDLLESAKDLREQEGFSSRKHLPK